MVGSISLLGHLGLGENFDSIGDVQAGDSLGEEGYFEVGTVTRKETAVATE